MFLLRVFFQVADCFSEIECRWCLSLQGVVKVALAQLQGAYNSTDYGMVMCGVLLATLPLFIIFLLFSRQFTADITAGAIKS